MSSPIALEKHLGVVAFAVAVAYWYGVPEAATVPRWIVAMLGLAILVWREKPSLKGDPADLLGAALLVWAALSLLWTTQILDGAFELMQWELVALPAFLLGAEARSLRPIFIGLSFALLPSAVLAIAQWYGWQGLYEVAPPSGLFMNKDPMAEIAALALVGCVGYRLWLASVPASVCFLLAWERTAIAALIVCGIAALWRQHRALTIALAVVAAPLGAAYVWHASAPGTALSDRYIYWLDTVDGLTPFGRGIGSFLTAWPEHHEHFAANQRDERVAANQHIFRPDHAHMDGLEAAFELGIPGLALFAFFWIACLGKIETTEQFVVLAFVVEGLAVFPLHYPTTLVVGMVCAGRAARSSQRYRALLDRGRLAFASWLGARDAEAEL